MCKTSLAATHALAKPQYGDKKESLLARSARLTLGTRTNAGRDLRRVELHLSRGEWGCCGCVPRAGPEGLSLEDPLSRRLHKEGRERNRGEGTRSHFSLRQQFKLNFFERPSDQKRAAKKEEGEGSASWSGRKRPRASVGSVGTHTEGHAAALGRSIQRDESG